MAKTFFFSSPSLEDLAYALAEGEHCFGCEATAAGFALIQWPGDNCPWFIPGPSAAGLDVEDFRIVEEF